MRIRVEVNITKLLVRGRFLSMGEREWWIPFKYECVLLFCFQCGAIEHEGNACSKDNNGGRLLDNVNSQYGPWLRAGAAISVGFGS